MREEDCGTAAQGPQVRRNIGGDLSVAALKALNQSAAAGEVQMLRAALEAARIPHTICDDCWYSCPKSGECCNEELPKDKCTCGADTHNAAIAAALKASV